jgi:hypothetical protein
MSARQLPRHGHSMPSRGLRSIKFFSDLVNEAFAIGQVKEIAGHLAQRRRFDRVPVLVWQGLGRNPWLSLMTGPGTSGHTETPAILSASGA